MAGFSHHDMDPGRSTAEGVELLRQYLEFAASGGTAMGGTLSDAPLNAFELNILRQLERRDMPVTPQYGVAGYRLDFACGHPDKPGRMVLAMEADGAAYHSTPTARDRDRLRQEVLENLGWRFHRIWSTEWFRDPEGQVALAEWVLSDTLLRTDDELLRELRLELGFRRGGSRINAALMQAIAVVRSRGS